MVNYEILKLSPLYIWNNSNLFDLKQVISTGTYWHSVPPQPVYWAGSIIFVLLLLKCTASWQSWGNIWQLPNGRPSAEWPAVFTNVKVKKDKCRWRSYSEWKETKRIMTTCDFTLGPGTGKQILMKDTFGVMDNIRLRIVSQTTVLHWVKYSDFDPCRVWGESMACSLEIQNGGRKEEGAHTELESRKQRTATGIGGKGNFFVLLLKTLP